jgi:dipeptidyl aminopeptidase/acylaminoacyl peptidase
VREECRLRSELCNPPKPIASVETKPLHALVRQWSLPLLSLLATTATAQPPAPTYREPPPAIREALDARPLPAYLIDPTGRHLAIVETRRFATLEELARPQLRLAGERIDAATSGPVRVPHIESLKLRPLARPKAKPREVRLPREGDFYGFGFSPDGERFVLKRRTAGGTELWVGSTASGSVARFEDLRLRDAFGESLDWLGSSTLLALAVPAGRGAAPVAPAVPAAPVVQESFNQSSQERTRPDLLRNAQDEALFDHHVQAQLMLIDLPTETLRPLGRPAPIVAVEPTGDGRHLLVRRLAKPYSYAVGWEDFGRVVELLDLNGRPLRELARVPLRNNVAVGGVVAGPRQFFVSPATDAAVYWVEALDGGDPRRTAAARDRVLRLAPPYGGEPREVLRLPHRLQRFALSEEGTAALVEDFNRDRARLTRRWADLHALPEPARVLAEWSLRERYADPGAPLTRTLANGRTALRTGEGGAIFLAGPGGSPEGDRPFLDRQDPATGVTQRLFRSEANAYETVVWVADETGKRLVTQRESAATPPQLRLRENGLPAIALTDTADPAPQLRKLKRELVRYKRADGVDLSFWLWLPPDYKPGERRPTLLWAYPLEFTDAATAGQVRGSPNRFFRPGGYSPVYLALAGFVVLEDATMPVIGDPETVNNSFIEQIVASATAAIDKAAGIGVTDPARVAVGGHSYGAFMAANLLAHTELFRAGIAASGAYNRTLTPFGFQGERRTLWEARDLYLRVSPFLYADRIKAPLLLVHGEADNNAGTFPLQSERMYQALAGTGGKVRYVALPLEGHNYAARESVGHVLAEMNAWLGRELAGER